MATLIPALGSCLPRMTGGEKRLARRLEDKLEDDYLLWYDVPIGRGNVHPDFIVLNPRRGLLILEVKDWRLNTIQEIDRETATIVGYSGLERHANPMEQARQYAHAVVDVLQRDPQLIAAAGRHAGRLVFPWSYGVVLANISRAQFEETNLREVFEPHRVICGNEMLESEDPEAFQQRLWAMFPFVPGQPLAMPQVDRIRWLLFPTVRIGPSAQGGLFDAAIAGDGADELSVPDLMQVMDLQQEQLARSLGDGHRVIHGVAGSGKTLILGCRAEQLAAICKKPVLVLCYNKTLARSLEQTMHGKGLGGKVVVHSFHQWCRAQLTTYNAGLPPKGANEDTWFGEMVEHLIRCVDRGLVPRAQYDALLIDEGHDFEPSWLKLVVQMVDPATNSVLLMYDDAQDIYARNKKGKFSFKSVGVQAQGRTTILKVNYRNTQEILRLASEMARELLQPAGDKADEDGVQHLVPISGGRHGPAPLVVKLPHLRAESDYLIERLRAAHQDGLPWSAMAVIYHDYASVGKAVLAAFRRAGVPVTYFRDMKFSAGEDSVKFLTMHSCKGLEFPLVAIPGLGRTSDGDAAREERARLLYVAMTRATQQLILSGA